MSGYPGCKHFRNRPTSGDPEITIIQEVKYRQEQITHL